MIVRDLMQALEARGTTLFVERGCLKLAGSPDAVPAALLSEVIGARKAIAETISANPCPHCGHPLYPHCPNSAAALAGACPNAAVRGPATL